MILWLFQHWKNPKIKTSWGRCEFLHSSKKKLNHILVRCTLMTQLTVLCSVGWLFAAEAPFLFCEPQLPYSIHFQHCQDAFDAMSLLTLFSHKVCSVLRSFTLLFLLLLPCDNFREEKKKKWTFDPALRKSTRFSLSVRRGLMWKLISSTKLKSGRTNRSWELLVSAPTILGLSGVNNRAVFPRSNETKWMRVTERDENMKEEQGDGKRNRRKELANNF